MTQQFEKYPALMSDEEELVSAAEDFFRAYWHLAGTAASQCANRVTPEEMTYATDCHNKAFRRLETALSLPRRTEADIRADERERIAVVIEKRFCGGEIIAEVIRAQGNN
jgi:hypothetical protein